MRRLADFLGTYDVDRRITDTRTGAETRFEGRAEIVPDGAGAIYREHGVLVMGEQRFEAERRYHWHEAGGRIVVSFDDGRPFHDFDPEEGGDATEHLCGEDLYRGGYDFSEWSCWSVTWRVTGPRKDYTSVTWFVRR